MHISSGHSLFLFVEARETRPHLKAMDSGHRHTKPKSIRGRMLLINRILLQSIRGRQAFSLDQVREVVRTFSIKYEPQGWRNRNHRASKCPNLPCGLPLCAPPSADRSHRPAAKCKDWGSTFTEPLMHWRCSQTDAMLLRVRGSWVRSFHSPGPLAGYRVRLGGLQALGDSACVFWVGNHV